MGGDDGNGEPRGESEKRGDLIEDEGRLASTTTNAFLAFHVTPLIVDAPFSRAAPRLSMKKSLRTVVIVLLSVGLLALFLRGAHLDVVWAEIRRANSWLIALSAVITVLTMVLRALRWQYLLAPIGHARFGPAFRTTTIGFAASAVLPARAGEVIRPYLLARQEGLSATATFATIIIERVLDAVTCVMLLASFVLFFDPGMDRADSRLYGLVEIGGIVVGALALLVLGAMFVAARDPEAVGRWAYKLEHLLPGRVTHTLAGRAAEVCRRTRGRAHAAPVGGGAVAVVPSVAVDRARHLGGDAKRSASTCRLPARSC